MDNNKHIAILQSELFGIIKENTLTPATLTNHKLRSPSSSPIINFSFTEMDTVPQYSYCLMADTIFINRSDIDSDDDLYFIDSASLDGFLNLEKHFKLIESSSIIECMQQTYDKVHEICNFAFGKKHIGLKRPAAMGDILDYVQYDGDNYCIRYDIYQSSLGHAFSMALYPIVNLQKRIVTLEYQILTEDYEFDDYDYALSHLYETHIFSKIGKNQEDLTLEDSLVLQMLHA